MSTDHYLIIAGYSDVIYLCSDHAGINLRGRLAPHLALSGYKVRDLGPSGGESVDYPDVGSMLAKALQEDPSARGIAICGSGIGITIAVNRFSWARAALVSDPVAARLCRQHNDANVLVLGSRLISYDEATKCILCFIKTSFEAGRHTNRLNKINKCL